MSGGIYRGWLGLLAVKYDCSDDFYAVYTIFNHVSFRLATMSAVRTGVYSSLIFKSLTIQNAIHCRYLPT